MNRRASNGEYIPYETLLAAKQGDTIAIEYIVQYFHGYIVYRSLRTTHREDGSTYEYVDSDVMRWMESELIEAIFKYEIR